ncbi:hypothetical protein JCM8208_002842 [Rhodotorula glutinis]
MAPAAQTYSHPAPFAPPPDFSEPIFLPADQTYIPQRIDDNACGPRGLFYLTKFRGTRAIQLVPSKYLADYPDVVEAYWQRDDVPHHERHPWGSKELIEGKKKYDEKLAATAKEEAERKAAAAAVAPAVEDEPEQPSSPESEASSMSSAVGEEEEQ